MSSKTSGGVFCEKIGGEKEERQEKPEGWGMKERKAFFSCDLMWPSTGSSGKKRKKRRGPEGRREMS